MDAKDLGLVWSQMVASHATRNANIREWREQAFAESFKREPIWEGGSSINLPITHWVVNLITDRLLLSQFSIRPLMHIRPISLEDFEIASALEEILNYYYQVSGKRDAVAQAITDMVLLGAGVVRIGWRVKKQKWGRERQVRYPFTDYIPLEHFYMLSPTLPMGEQGAVAFRYWRRRGDLLQEYDEELVNRLSHTEEDRFFVKDLEVRSTTDRLPNDIIELVEIFYRDDENKWRVATYSPQGVVLKDEEFKYPTDTLPFFLLRSMGNGYGYGIAPMLKPLEEELSVLHNQRIDNNTLINLPVFKVLTSSPASRDNETWFAGKKLLVDTPEDVTILAQPERITPLQDEQQLFEYIKLLSGVSEILSGAPLRGERTAFEIETMMLEGSVRFRRLVLSVGDWLTEQAKYELLLLKHYGGREVNRLAYAKRFNFNPFELIEDEDILYRFEYIYNTILTNREVERQKWVLLRNLLATDPLMANNPRGWYELVRQTLDAFGVDWRTIIGEQRPPEPAPPVAGQPALPVEGERLSPDVLAMLGALVPSLGSMRTGGE